MTKAVLSDIYRDYIACLNKQDWPSLRKFITKASGSGYQAIARCWREIFVRIPAAFHEERDDRIGIGKEALSGATQSLNALP
jgi:predicted ester cyclase